MPALAYTVRATLPNHETAAAYIAWLRDGHLDAVIAGGARSAQVVQVEDPAAPVRVEVRYIFQARAEFERYVRETAPRLRAEGLAQFGPDSGVSFERTVGALVAEGTGPQRRGDPPEHDER
ncbi:MAG: DUF4286 family protein [Phycisphaerales bacterium]|nr:DUF4286 family protein [Phycisphaerales bacterium]